MGLNNAQRNLGYRDEYVYNVKTGKFYLETPGDNYREITLVNSISNEGEIEGDLTVSGSFTAEGGVTGGNVYIPVSGLLWGNNAGLSKEGFAIGGNGVSFMYHDRGNTGTANECIWFNNASGGIRLGEAASELSDPKIDIRTNGEILSKGGVILVSPNGTSYKLAVADDGTLSTSAV